MFDAIDALPRAIDREQARANQLAALALGEVAPHDDVVAAGSVFQRDEHDVGGGGGRWRMVTRPATRRRDPADADLPVLAELQAQRGGRRLWRTCDRAARPADDGRAAQCDSDM